MGKDRIERIAIATTVVAAGGIAVVENAQAESPATEALAASGLVISPELQIEQTSTPIFVNIEGTSYLLPSVDNEVQQTVDRAMDIYRQNFAVRGINSFDTNGLFVLVPGALESNNNGQPVPTAQPSLGNRPLPALVWGPELKLFIPSTMPNQEDIPTGEFLGYLADNSNLWQTIGLQDENGLLIPGLDPNNLPGVNFEVTNTNSIRIRDEAGNAIAEGLADPATGLVMYIMDPEFRFNIEANGWERIFSNNSSVTIDNQFGSFLITNGAGIEASVLNATFEASLNMLPESYWQRTTLSPEDPNYIYFDYARRGFVDQRGYVWRSGAASTELGWMKQTEVYTWEGHNFTLHIEVDPHGFTQRDYNFARFNENFRNKFPGIAEEYLGHDFDNKHIFLQYLGTYNRDAVDLEHVQILAVNGNTIADAYQSTSMDDNVLFIRNYTDGSASLSLTINGNTYNTNDLDNHMASMVVINSLVLLRSNFWRSEFYNIGDVLAPNKSPLSTQLFNSFWGGSGGLYGRRNYLPEPIVEVSIR